MIEARHARLFAVLFPAPTGLGDQNDFFKFVRFANTPGKLEAVYSGQADIDQGKLRNKFFQDFERARRVVSRTHDATEYVQEHGDTGHLIGIVVDDENPS